MQSAKGYDEIDDKLIDIVVMLTEQTEEGKVEWSVMESKPSQFTTVFPASSIRVEKFLSEYYRVSLLGSDNRSLRTINASDLDEFYDTFARLYESARKSAQQPEVVLDDIIAHLSKGASV